MDTEQVRIKTINNPLGVGGKELHQWLVPTHTFQRALFGKDGGTTVVDDDFRRPWISECWGLDCLEGTFAMRR